MGKGFLWARPAMAIFFIFLILGLAACGGGGSSSGGGGAPDGPLVTPVGPPPMATGAPNVTIFGTVWRGSPGGERIAGVALTAYISGYAVAQCVSGPDGRYSVSFFLAQPGVVTVGAGTRNRGGRTDPMVSPGQTVSADIIFPPNW